MGTLGDVLEGLRKAVLLQDGLARLERDVDGLAEELKCVARLPIRSIAG